MKPPVVSIIIPVFNKCELTAQCLHALFQSPTRVPFEVIVVDNASSDRTPQQLAEFGARIRVIRRKTNGGFAVACNEGAAAAIGEHVLLLNNDTIPLPGWLEPLVNELQTHPEVAVVGSKLLFQNGLVQHAGVAFTRDSRNPFHPHLLLRADDLRVNARRELQAVTGACMLVRKSWFGRCGRLNESYLNGYEDLEFCLQVRKQGGTIVYQPKSALIHLESQTPGRKLYDNQNRALFFQRWSESLLSDEDAYYFADGYYLIERRSDWPPECRLARLDSEEARRSWRVVAQTQLAAAAHHRQELSALLNETESWPANAAALTWAGVLCLRYGLGAASRRHLERALQLREDAELRLRLQPSTAGTATPGVQAQSGSWAGLLADAQSQLLNSELPGARKCFEAALAEGAPARLALPGCWEASSRLGACEAATTVDWALSHLPRLDRDTKARLGFGPAAGCKVLSLPEAPPRPVVSIIILALNQLEHTRACLASLAAHTPAPHEVIVVDNGSTDGTKEFLEAWQAGQANHLVIRNRENAGFAAGNNQGLALAKGEVIILLNNDTIVTEGWSHRMLGVLSRHPDTGIVGPMSNFVSGPQLVRQVDYTDTAGLPAFAARLTAEHQGQSLEIARAVGFCLAVRRQVIEAIGGLDDRFGLGNFEDDDFCLRARLAGFRIRVAQDAFVHHTGSQTFKGANINYRDAMRGNWALFKAKWKLPPHQALEQGYPLPKVAPSGLSLLFALPKLEASHEPQPLVGLWIQRARVSKPSAPLAVSAQVPTPACAEIGALKMARDRMQHRELATAWQATLAALTQRPFHPEAFLLLAEIAHAAGDFASARLCAERARHLAPPWKPARRFLQKCPNNGKPQDWLVLPASVGKDSGEVKPRLSVCLITKNEQQFLGQSLESVRAVADQIVVVDTGSTDRTVEIAQSLGAEVHHFKWCDDFSAARNAALEQARGDWILILDADEELPADQHARLLADMRNDKLIAFRLPMINRGKENEGRAFVPRLFRNAPGVHFRGRIHEQIFPSLLPLAKTWGLGTGLGTAQLVHHGYAPEIVKERNKNERNLALLRQAILEQPEDPNMAMNLGLELVRHGEFEEGLAHYREAFRLMSAQSQSTVAPELREVLLTQFVTYLHKVRAYDEIVAVLNSELAKRRGLTASLHLFLGLAQFELKQFGEAAAEMRHCLAKRQEPALSPINTDILTAVPHHCLAASLAQAGDIAGADQAFQAGLAETQRVEDLRFAYAKFLVDQQRLLDALHRLHEIVAENGRHASAWRLGGQIALSRPDFLEFGCDWTYEAVKHLPEDAGITAQRAEILLLSGQVQGARELWAELCGKEREPRSQAALILCDLIEGQPLHLPETEAEAAGASRAFIQWYQKCLTTPARKLVPQINERLEDLHTALPSAASMIQAALAEAEETPIGVEEPCPA